MSFMKFYRGMTVLITGASSGFGKEFAGQLAPWVGKLILVALDQVGLESVQKSLKEKHPDLEIQISALDLSDTKARDQFCDQLLADGVKIHFLVNNAGLGDVGRFATMDPLKFRRIFEVNVVALTALTYRVLPLMPKEGRRAILNLSSLAGVFPAPLLAAYAASKAYVSSLSEALRIELAGKGIGVTAVCPGPVDTGFGGIANRNGKSALPGPAWFKGDAETVVSASLKAVAHNRARVFPGYSAWVFAFIFSLVPMCLFRRVMATGSGR
jgi:uncharacterized protein